MRDRLLEVTGAAENNLRDVDVTIGPGLTAVVGVSGSGKSSLAFDVVYHEARRRFFETVSLGSPWLRMRPANVRHVAGLGPAVSIAQNVLNRNPNSTVASAVGLHPFLRILFARFADVRCPDCGTEVRALSDEERVRRVVEAGGGAIDVPLVRAVEGSHARLLGLLAERFRRTAIRVDGRAWDGKPLDAASPHDIVVRTSRIAAKDATAATVRAELARADALGSHEVAVDGQTLLRAPVCPTCGAWVPPLPATAFRPGWADTSSHTIGGVTLDALLSGTVADGARFVDSLGATIGAGGKRLVDELERRVRPMMALGLEYLTLDRPMPTLSRGESQRARIAVVLAGRLEDLLHVLDEPSIGLHRRDVRRLFDALGGLAGPVLMVEHDAAAVANADDVIELGPAAGPDGGRVVFQGTPAALWKASTASGRLFSRAEQPVVRARRKPAGDFLRVVGASARNLDGFDCAFPVGCLTVVTGPSGAGKTTLVRDVLLASVRDGSPVGCRALRGPASRAIEVDQSPLGNNPRSNPATYTKVFDRIRALFASETGSSASAFTFNRPEGACPECEGMGAVEVRLPYLAPVWIGCEACDGRRFRPETLAQQIAVEGRSLSIADALAMSIDEARALFWADKGIVRVLDALVDVGLGYLELGQPSPTLSGGEAQRVRLARELARARHGDLVVLDEPTTGLHPADLGRLVSALDALTATGCTVVVVEHQPDLVAAADWLIDLGPGGGPDGGRLLSCGVPSTRRPSAPAPRRSPRRRPRASATIRVRGASANNLRDVDVDIPKGSFTAVVGVSGSGKSSLVRDVLAAEATRRLLECLSMYERQATTEGPQAPVRSLDGLGPTLVLGPDRRGSGRRGSVGSASELDRLLALVIARLGERACTECSNGRVERLSPVADAPWRCGACGADAVPLEPRHLNPSTYAAACMTCSGLGAIQEGVVERLIVDPDAPICGGAMHSPGYFPRNYLCTSGTGGHSMLRAVAERYGFDPATTPWRRMSAKAQRAFLWGDAELRWKGVLTELTYWDAGGLYTRTRACDACGGRRLRPDYLTIRIGGHDRSDLHTVPVAELEGILRGVDGRRGDLVARDALSAATRRVAFLGRVGLGYVHLDQPTRSLSAGEAQRVKLASVLGGGLLGMTVLLDEPSRGLHPREVDGLATALVELRDARNTVIAVEHDARLVRRADHVIEIGPGAGNAGGRVVGQGPPAAGTVAPPAAAAVVRARREPSGWMRVTGAREHNLTGDEVRVPLGVLAGVCGVSGSGKSTLAIDTIGLALAPPKLTTSVATVRYEPGEHDAIEGAPERTVVADQTRAGITSPGIHLGIIGALRKAYAASDDAMAAGITESDLTMGCDACSGGTVSEDMGFLPSVAHPCDACDGTGYTYEARTLRVRGHTLPEVEAMTIDAMARDWSDVAAIARASDAACRLGVGYLTVRQPSWSLSGGEAQRLKLARELSKRATKPTLYILDEPTVGLHGRDVDVLVRALNAVVDAGHSVLAVEHDPQLLASCDWLIELGPGGGPGGGRVIATGTPEDVAASDTPTAPFLREALP